MSENIKARHWLVVVYPESAPDDWKDLLAETGVQFAISPLHNKDVDTNGEIKKAHWHIILSWDNTTTYNNVKRLTERINSPMPKKCESVKGSFRYFTHKDDPSKYQYNEDDIEIYNGFDIDDITQPTTTERYSILFEIVNFCDENNITEYYILIKKLMEEDKEMCKVAMDNTMFLTSMLRSKRITEQNETIQDFSKDNSKKE